MTELSGPWEWRLSAHKYKGPDDAREPDRAHPVTMTVARGARAERPIVEHGKASRAGCALRRLLNRYFHYGSALMDAWGEEWMRRAEKCEAAKHRAEQYEVAITAAIESLEDQDEPGALRILKVALCGLEGRSG